MRATSYGLRSSTLLLLAAGVFAVGSRPSVADDAKPADAKPADAKPADAKPVDETTAKVKELEDGAKKHIADAADDALKTDVKTAAQLAGDAADPKLKERCRIVVGAILKSTQHEDVQKVAIKAIGDMGIAAGYAYLQPFLQQATPDSEPQGIQDAIEACGKLKADDSVNPLLTLVENSHKMPIAVAAMKALSNFGESKSKREIIVDRLVATVAKDVPGVGYRWTSGQGIGGSGVRAPTAKTRSGEAIVTRYNALSGELVTTLNKLTGQNVASAEEWFGLRDKYKGRLGELFPKNSAPPAAPAK